MREFNLNIGETWLVVRHIEIVRVDNVEHRLK
jgi:hypothetical protein